MRTGDSSWTVLHPVLEKPYHSAHGALDESRHVFLRAGLEATGGGHVRVLEVGLGTGLNMLLAWVHCLDNKGTVHYTALEPNPLHRSDIEPLQHCTAVGYPERHEQFLQLMCAPEAVEHPVEGGFTLLQLRTPIEQYEACDAFDVVYFDVFAPSAAPELWTLEVFQRLHKAMAPGGLLVTYCAKGVVRRTMQAAGFAVERIPGPPGKRHMLRARKGSVATMQHDPST